MNYKWYVFSILGLLTIFYQKAIQPNLIKKRTVNQIKFVIFHYTGMRRENDAIKKLTSAKSKVSCHYLINRQGKIIQKDMISLKRL